MALQINLPSTNENNHLNHDFPQAYVRISKFGGSKNNITYKVQVYPNSSSANVELETPGSFIFQEHHVIHKNDSDISINLSSVNVMTELYTNLKTHETYKDGIDV